MGNCRYHITMQVVSEEESAIRSLFYDNKWICLMKGIYSLTKKPACGHCIDCSNQYRPRSASQLMPSDHSLLFLLSILSEETVADIIQCGFTDVFPFPSGDDECNPDMTHEMIREVKSEIINVEMADSTSSLRNLNEIQIKEGLHLKGKEQQTMIKELDVSGEIGVENDGFDDQGDDKDMEFGSDNTDIVDEASAESEHTEHAVHDLAAGLSSEKNKDNATSNEVIGNVNNLNKKHKIKQKCQIKNRKGKKIPNSGGQWKCEACGNFYKDKRCLRKHYYCVHRDMMPKPSCPVCNEVFKTRAEMFKHKREKEHNTSLWMLKDYYCDACGKHLSRYDSLLKHKRFVCGNGECDGDRKTYNYPCDLCGKLFKEKHYLEAHKERMHCKVEKVCDICGKVCIDERSLKCHRVRHDEINKKYKCSYCEKTFFSAANLNQHVRIHTKEKPYKCPLCSYTSGVMGNVKKHTTNVHKQKLTAIDLRKVKKIKETQPVQQSYVPNLVEYYNQGLDSNWQQ